MKKIVLAIAIIATSISSNAQFGSLLKKAKDKVTEKKTVETSTTATSNSQNTTNGNGNTSKLSIPKSDVSFTLFDQKYGYRSASNDGTVATFIADKRMFSPYRHVRKYEETGCFHFAKDYPELAPVVEPLNNDLVISFSNSSFSNTGANVANSFTSGQNIYGKISTTKGTLKDALKISDNDDGIKISFTLYDNEEETINSFSIGETFILTAAQANSKSVTFDIIPDLKNYTTGKQSDFTAVSFAANHTQYVFKRNGNYNVGVFVKNEKVDDWGKPIYGDDIIFANFFDYTFSAKDAAKIKKEQSEINDLKNVAKKNAITELPEQWKEKSSALVMGLTQDKLTQMLLGADLKSLKLIKFFASSSNGGWTAIYDQSAVIPTYRKSNQYYTVFYKIVNPANTNNGKCWFQTFGLRQQYMGGGTYGVSTIDANEWHFAECDKMK